MKRSIARRSFRAGAGLALALALAGCPESGATGSPDMEGPPGLGRPDLVAAPAPPSTVWLSGGGGGAGAGGLQLDVVVAGTVVGGESVAPDGQSVSFGAFSTAVY